jgi:hypothetical protein
MGGTCSVYSVVWCRNLKERDGFGDLGIDGNIILKLVLNVIFLSVGRATGI